MSEEKFERFMRSLKRVVDDHSPYGSHYTNGPMDIRFYSFRDDKGKGRRGVKIESGVDENYGGWVAIEASPKGKSLTVRTSEQVRIESSRGGEG